MSNAELNNEKLYTECRTYEEKKKGCKHTEEYKEYMSRVMKEKWQCRKEREE